MIKLLTFSTLYPSSVRSNHGIFVETRLRKLLDSVDIESVVIAPVPWFPFVNEKFGDYAKYARTPYEEIRKGIRVLHPRYPLLPKIGMSTAPLLLAISMLPTIKGLIRDGYNFDLIDAHYFYPDGVAATILGQYFKKPVTITARGTDINLIPTYALPRKMILWAAERASGLITVCQALKDAMVMMGVDDKRIVSLRNGVDLGLFRPIDRLKCRKELGLEAFTLFSVGGLIERKGHGLVIQSLVNLPDVILMIAGIGPDRNRLELLSKELGVQDRVKLLGAVDHSELLRYYNAADVLVLASSREGWANVLLESMACGTPVIASNVWGTPEIVRCAAAGLLMEELTAECIVQSVNTLRSQMPDRKMTRNYAEQYSWEDTSKGQFALFREILKKRN